MYKEWVADVTLIHPSQPDLLCFVPIENAGQPNEVLVLGMNLLTTPEGFKERGGAKCIGIVHMDGQKAVEKWISDNADIVKRLKQIKED